MDNSKIEAAIESFRRSIKDVDVDSIPPLTFCGEEVKRLPHQRKLDNMDSDSRIHVMQEDLEYTFTDRVHELATEGESNENENLILNARALCQEWGSVVGLEDHIPGDNPQKYLRYETQAALKHKLKQKANIRKLFDSKN